MRAVALSSALLGLWAATTTPAWAQLTRVSVGLSAFDRPALAWGDYDGDGDLDLVLAGEAHGDKTTALFRNNGGTFATVAVPFVGVQNAALSWGDYDNDGDLDLLVSGETDTATITHLYRNNGGSFDLASTFTGLTAGSAAWGDYDNDGDLDLLLCGITGISSGSAPVLTRLYRNDAGTFILVPTALPNVYLGSVAWNDYDNDGDVDVLISGATGGFGAVCKIYRNEGNAVFTELEAGFPNVNLGNATWGDYDADGDWDVVVTGNGGNPGLTKLFRNDGGVFVDRNAVLPPVLWSWASWADYDNDGDLDLAIMGYNGTTPETRMFRNDAGVFTDSNAVLEGIYLGQNGWADYNNDGRLDLLLAGQRDVNLGTAAWLYRNSVPNTNTPPQSPSGLAVHWEGTNAWLSWNRAIDAQTPTPALTYNVRVGTNTNGGQLISSQSLPGNGWRLLPQGGNAGFQTNLLLKGLVPGRTYYWSVQAVDSACTGSPFAGENRFVVPSIVGPADLRILWNGRAVTLHCAGSAGASYGVEFTRDLSTSASAWIRVGSATADDTGAVQWTDPTPLAERGFYRITYP